MKNHWFVAEECIEGPVSFIPNFNVEMFLHKLEVTLIHFTADLLIEQFCIVWFKILEHVCYLLNTWLPFVKILFLTVPKLKDFNVEVTTNGESNEWVYRGLRQVLDFNVINWYLPSAHPFIFGLFALFKLLVCFRFRRSEEMLTLFGFWLVAI